MLLACKLRNQLFAKLAALGIRRPVQATGHEDYDTDDFSVTECEIAERLKLLIERHMVRERIQKTPATDKDPDHEQADKRVLRDQHAEPRIR